jgi:diguanylate cyclase (GGDEF)-like protein
MIRKVRFDSGVLNTVLIALLICGLAFIVAIGTYTLFFTQSKKKNWLCIVCVAVFLFLLGHLLELLAPDASAAFTAVCVLYIGSSFVGPVTFFFVADYCEVKLSTALVKVPLLLLALIVTVCVWTTDIHHLFYESYWFDTTHAHALNHNSGILHTVFQFLPVGMLLASAVIIVKTMRRWDKTFYRHYLALLGTVLIPLVAELIYYLLRLAGLNTMNIFITPYSLALMSICLYSFVVRYDMLGIETSVSEKAVDYISEAYILLDNNNNYLMSNPAAKVMLPGLLAFKNGVNINNLPSWPAELRDFDRSQNSSSIEYVTSRASTSLVVHAGNESDNIDSNGLFDRHYFIAEIKKVQHTARFFGKGHAVWAFLIRDMTSQHIMMKRLEEFASNDPLTGLSNRRHFRELAEPVVNRALRMETPYYLIMLDLDHFKDVNDKHGHLAGDEVLKTTACVLRDAVRKYDLVSRYGGEEFLILVADVSEEVMDKLAERIRSRVEQSVSRYGSHEMRVTISIGVAKSRENTTFNQLLELADNALYHAKKARNTICCNYS